MSANSSDPAMMRRSFMKHTCGYLSAVPATDHTCPVSFQEGSSRTRRVWLRTASRTGRSRHPGRQEAHGPTAILRRPHERTVHISRRAQQGRNLGRAFRGYMGGPCRWYCHWRDDWTAVTATRRFCRLLAKHGEQESSAIGLSRASAASRSNVFRNSFETRRSQPVQTPGPNTVDACKRRGDLRTQLRVVCRRIRDSTR